MIFMSQLPKLASAPIFLRSASPYLWINKRGKQSSRKRNVYLCACGAEFIAVQNKVLYRKTTQCSTCGYKSRPQSVQRYTGEERLYRMYQTRAKRAHLNFELSLERFTKLIEQDCNYCGAHPRTVNHLLNNKHAKRNPIQANGIDRLDPQLGYLEENCVSACWPCNKMKNTLTISQFYDILYKILRYKGFIKK